MMHTRYPIHSTPRPKFAKTVGVSLILTILIVVLTAALGRAVKNFQGALIEKPDIAIYLLLPEEQITGTTLLREADTERAYLAQTETGPKLVILKKGETEWFVATVEPMRE